MQPEGGGPNDPQAWIQYARSDFFIAENKLESSMLENHCFHAQQCVEKSLKAVCVCERLKFPYTHDLAELLEIIFKGRDAVPDWAREAKRLTSYATASRYPGFDEPITEVEWQDAVRIAKIDLDLATIEIQNNSEC